MDTTRTDDFKYESLERKKGRLYNVGFPGFGKQTINGNTASSTELTKQADPKTNGGAKW